MIWFDTELQTIVPVRYLKKYYKLWINNIFVQWSRRFQLKSTDEARFQNVSFQLENLTASIRPPSSLSSIDETYIMRISTNFTQIFHTFVHPLRNCVGRANRVAYSAEIRYLKGEFCIPSGKNLWPFQEKLFATHLLRNFLVHRNQKSICNRFWVFCVQGFVRKLSVILVNFVHFKFLYTRLSRNHSKYSPKILFWTTIMFPIVGQFPQKQIP